MLKYLVFSCAIILSIDLNAAFQGGAPVEVCQTLMPNHGVEPQTVASPFLIRVSGNAKIRSTGSLNVTIQGKDEFKGFILQARESKKNTIIGSFEPSSKAKLLDCSPGKSNAVTHKNSNAARSAQFTWKPNGFKGQAYFIATVVKTGVEFWTNLKSTNFEVV